MGRVRGHRRRRRHSADCLQILIQLTAATPHAPPAPTRKPPTTPHKRSPTPTPTHNTLPPRTRPRQRRASTTASPT
ncbi:hypothetical protein DFH06DRAFT_1085956, partial [Mycena polygramma]